MRAKLQIAIAEHDFPTKTSHIVACLMENLQIV